MYKECYLNSLKNEVKKGKIIHWMNKERKKNKQVDGKETHHLIDASDSFVGISILVDGDHYPKVTKLFETARVRIGPPEVE